MDLIYTDYLGINIHTQEDNNTAPDSTTNDNDDCDNNKEYIPHSTVYKQPNYDIIRLNPLFNHMYSTYTHQTLGQYINTINTNTTTNNTNTNTTSSSNTYTQDLTTTFLNEGVKEEEEDVMDWSTSIYLSTNKPEYTSTITTTAPSTVTSSTTPSTNCAENSTSTISNIKLAYLRTIHLRSAVRIPRLSEICYKKVAESAVYVTEEMAKLGGSRPDVPWMQVYTSYIIYMLLCVILDSLYIFYMLYSLYLHVIYVYLYYTSIIYTTY